MTAIEENDTPSHTLTTLADPKAPTRQRNRLSDQGPEVLPDMEHFVMLARKTKRPALVLKLLQQAGGTPPPEMAVRLEDSTSMLPPASRQVLFHAVSRLPGTARQPLEAAAERVVLLDDEYGDQAVRSLLDDQDARDADLLTAPTDRYSRALYLYLRQEDAEPETRVDRRFDHAEHLQTLHRQWKNEHFSSHYLGPQGVVLNISPAVGAALRSRIVALYPNVPPEDIVIEHFTRRHLAHADQCLGEESDHLTPAVLQTLTVTFNGSMVHFKKVQGGEVMSFDDEAALAVSFSWEPVSGALGVFSEDREHRRALARLFRDVVLAGDGAISELPIREFELISFATPEILERLESDRIPGIESIAILHLRLARPFKHRIPDATRGRDRVPHLSSTITVSRDRRDLRNLYQVAYEDHGLSDLTGYKLSQVKLVLRMSQQPYRKAHNVAVQITAPNGLNDRSKTEDDRKRVLAQLARLGILREF
ncbi:MAG: hypothetical protein WA970_22600 [Gammaproteobacteria bacterium]